MLRLNAVVLAFARLLADVCNDVWKESRADDAVVIPDINIRQTYNRWVETTASIQPGSRTLHQPDRSRCSQSTSEHTKRRSSLPVVITSTERHARKVKTPTNSRRSTLPVTATFPDTQNAKTTLVARRKQSRLTEFRLQISYQPAKTAKLG